MNNCEQLSTTLVWSPALIRIHCSVTMKFALSFEVLGSNLSVKRRPGMKPTFDQVLRLVVCVAGLVFFGVAIWMVQKGISANGVIDIKSEVLSGHLETGSAGLFLAFFSFLMIVLPILIRRPGAKSLARGRTNPASLIS